MILVIEYSTVKAKRTVSVVVGASEIHPLRHIGESYLEMRLATKFSSLDRSVVQPL